MNPRNPMSLRENRQQTESYQSDSPSTQNPFARTRLQSALRPPPLRLSQQTNFARPFHNQHPTSYLSDGSSYYGPSESQHESQIIHPRTPSPISPVITDEITHGHPGVDDERYQQSSHESTPPSLPSKDTIDPAYRSSTQFFEPRVLNPPNSNWNADGTRVVRPVDRSYILQNSSGLARQPSLLQKAKQAVSGTKPFAPGKINSSTAIARSFPSREEQMAALSAAIAEGYGNQQYQSNQQQRPPLPHADSGVRMPFESVSSDSNEEHHRSRSSSPTLKNPGSATKATKSFEYGIGNEDLIAEQSPSHLRNDSYQRQDYLDDRSQTVIENSSQYQPSPVKKRPPRLDIDAVREAESRGSLTSLPDLIRRATRLASNLDRGKTASKLGVLDMFGYDEKHGNRDSRYSQMLSSFPPPIGNDNSMGYATNQWPLNDNYMQNNTSKSRGSKKKRRCCGLSVTAFIFVFIVVVLLIAAAILIPIFLIVVPRENAATSTDLHHCAASHPCQNGGVSVVDDNACSCICMDGYTGNDCTTDLSPNCGTTSIQLGSQTYDNATIGSSITSLISSSQSQFNIPINITVLLSTFSANNLSCVSENSLVRFRSNITQAKRFVVVPGLESDIPALRSPHADPVEEPLDKRFIVVPGLVPNHQSGDEPLLHIPSHSGHLVSITNSALMPRDTSSVDYQAPTTTVASSTDSSLQTSTSATISTDYSLLPSSYPTHTESTYYPAITSDSSANSTSSPSIKMNSTIITSMTPSQLTFAQLSVLYILTISRRPIIAVTAQQSIERYFLAGGLTTGNSTVEIAGPDVDADVNYDGMNMGTIVANFQSLALVLTDGTVIGQSKNNG